MVSPRIAMTGQLAGRPGRDGANVLPTAEAVRNSLQNDAIVQAALSASIAAGAGNKPGTRMGLLGDSITDGNYSVSGEGTLWGQGAGYFVQANQLLGQRFDLVYQTATDPEFGTSGATTGSILQNGDHLQLIAAKPDVAFLLIGTNDLTNSSAGADATIFGRWKQIADSIVAAGIELIAATIPARLVSSDTTTQIANHHALNRRIRDYAAATPGVILCDWYNTLANADTGRADTKYLGDDVHPNTTGAGRLGRFLADLLGPLFPATDRRPAMGDPANIVTGSWVDGPANATVAFSNVASTDMDPRQWRQMATSAITGTDANSMASSRILSATVASGEKYQGVLEFQTDAASWAVRAFYVGLKSVGALPATYDGYKASDSITIYRPTAGVFRTPVLTVPAGVTQLQLEVRAYGVGTTRVRAPGILKVP